MQLRDVDVCTSSKLCLNFLWVMSMLQMALLLRLFSSSMLHHSVAVADQEIRRRSRVGHSSRGSPSTCHRMKAFGFGALQESGKRQSKTGKSDSPIPGQGRQDAGTLGRSTTGRCHALARSLGRSGCFTHMWVLDFHHSDLHCSGP